MSIIWDCEFQKTETFEFSPGLEILAFPCNQFAGQEPGTNDEIQDVVCTRFKSEFPVFDKVISDKYFAIYGKISLFLMHSIYAIGSVMHWHTLFMHAKNLFEDNAFVFSQARICKQWFLEGYCSIDTSLYFNHSEVIKLL